MTTRYAPPRLGEPPPLPVPPIALCAGCGVRKVARVGQQCAVCAPDYDRGHHERRTATDADLQAWAALVPTFTSTPLPAWRLACPRGCGTALAVLADATDLAPDAGVLASCPTCGHYWWVTLNRRMEVTAE